MDDKNEKKQESMTCRDAGIKGGRATVSKYGLEYMAKISRKGVEAQRKAWGLYREEKARKREGTAVDGTAPSKPVVKHRPFIDGPREDDRYKCYMNGKEYFSRNGKSVGFPAVKTIRPGAIARVLEAPSSMEIPPHAAYGYLDVDGGVVVCEADDSVARATHMMWAVGSTLFVRSVHDYKVLSRGTK